MSKQHFFDHSLHVNVSHQRACLYLFSINFACCVFGYVLAINRTDAFIRVETGVSVQGHGPRP